MSTGDETRGLIGVLGGMGPLATIDFMHKVLAATPADADQDHVPMLVSSIPQVPDRAAAFRGDGVSPLAAMIASGRHLWSDDIQRALGLPMLHLVDATLADAVAAVGGSGAIGLLCTDATLASGLYVNRAPQVRWALPTAHEMRDWVMPGIRAVKAGELDRGAELLVAAAQALARRGAQVLVLGCTEVPLVLGASNAPVPVIDATASLARRAVAWSLAERRPT